MFASHASWPMCIADLVQEVSGHFNTREECCFFTTFLLPSRSTPLKCKSLCEGRPQLPSALVFSCFWFIHSSGRPSWFHQHKDCFLDGKIPYVSMLQPFLGYLRTRNQATPPMVFLGKALESTWCTTPLYFAHWKPWTTTEPYTRSPAHSSLSGTCDFSCMTIGYLWFEEREAAQRPRQEENYYYHKLGSLCVNSTLAIHNCKLMMSFKMCH